MGAVEVRGGLEEERKESLGFLFLLILTSGIVEMSNEKESL